MRLLPAANRSELRVEETITSRENAKIKYACKLSGSAAFRRAENAFLAEGLKLCCALAKGAILKVLYYTARAVEKSPELLALPGEHFCITEPVAEKLADVGTNQGVFGIFEIPQADETVYKAGGRYLALEGVQDPGNTGTLLRSAAAFGFDGVILGAGCASPWAPKTLRASMGAAVQVPVLETEDLPGLLGRLRTQGITCLAAALYRSEPLDAAQAEYPGGVCVVIGSEGQGLTEAAIAACDQAIRIPMTDRVESLNAGIAGSILLWHFRGVGQ
jgi:TrmH family RNA methyltransferase